MDSTDDEKETDGTRSSGPVLNCITAKTPTRRRDTHYYMKHKNRGLALIFNHEKFKPHLNLEKRLGTNQDVGSLEPMLTNLGFKVFVYTNNSLSALNRRIREAAKHDHTDYDCFVMVVLTHGDTNDLLYANDSCYTSANLWLPFTADSCPTLAGKPKLFFIQACRGLKCMPPVAVEFVKADWAPNASYKIPAHADFLFFYASSPGYVSLRNTETGTWFIQALCRVFGINAYKYDILTFLTFVIQSVAIDCEAYLLDKNYSTGEQKQIPCFTTNLTRLVRFERKINQIPYPESLVSSLNLLRKVTISESKPDDAVDAVIENAKVTESSTTASDQEQPTRLVEDHGEHQTDDQKLEEPIVNYPVPVETKSTEFVLSVLFFALTHKK